MNEISALFDSLYNKFLMRDVFAKIMPGLVALIASLVFLKGSVADAFQFLAEFSYWRWLLLPLAWVAGFVLQHGGLMAKVLTDPTYEMWKKNDEPGLGKRFEAKIDALARKDPEYLKALERTVIIKEACGNSCIAASYALLLYLVHYLLRLLFGGRPGIHNYALVIIVVVTVAVSIVVLRNSHKFQAKREEYFRENYMRMEQTSEGKIITDAIVQPHAPTRPSRQKALL